MIYTQAGEPQCKSLTQVQPEKSQSSGIEEGANNSDHDVIQKGAKNSDHDVLQKGANNSDHGVILNGGLVIMGYRVGLITVIKVWYRMGVLSSWDTGWV